MGIMGKLINTGAVIQYYHIILMLNVILITFKKMPDYVLSAQHVFNLTTEEEQAH